MHLCGHTELRDGVLGVDGHVAVARHQASMTWIIRPWADGRAGASRIREAARGERDRAGLSGCVCMGRSMAVESRRQVVNSVVGMLSGYVVSKFWGVAIYQG